MDSQVLTEAALLSRLPPGSRIISPSTITCIKHPDGQWWNWSNDICTGLTLQAHHVISAGSKAYYSNEGRACYVKHPDGRWLSTSTPGDEAFAPNTAAAHPSGHHGTAPSLTGMQIISQAIYHNGPVPTDDAAVLFNVPLSSAARGDVGGKDHQAFAGELTVKEKVSIRFGFPYIGSSGYKAKQHNLKRGNFPITRGQLATIVAEEVRKVVTALAQCGAPIAVWPNSLPVAFQDLILVDVRRVSDGTLQPTIARRGA